MRAASLAALLGAAACCFVAAGQAQTAAPAKPKAADSAGGGGKVSSLGDARPGGKLLSREELRACLTQQSALGTRKPALEAQREKLDRERQEFLRIDESLKADRAAMDRLAETAANLNKRIQELSAQIADFNERVAKFKDSGRSGATAERQRNDFEREKKSLDSSAQALDGERATLGPNAEQALQNHKSRLEARDQAAVDWNARNTTLARSVRDYDTDLQTWTADCSGRSYREDDEKAILSAQ